jgi:aminoglycoside phosphotransferase (APT) family kinase protein
VTDFIDLARDRDALLRLLHDTGIARPGDEPAIRLLSGGVSGNILVAELEGRSVCVKQALPQLKVAREWLAPVGRIFAEIEWLQAAAALIPGHVPGVLAIDRGHRAFVMEYLPETDYANWKLELLAGRVDCAVGTQLGDLLGRMHSGTAHRAEAARRFSYEANFFALRLDPYLLESARVHPDLAPQLVGLVHVIQTNRHAVVHGDVSPKNVLLGKRGPVILDAECAYYGDPAFDVAFLLNHILLKAVKVSGIAAGWTNLFNDIVIAYRPYVSWEPADAFESRVAALLPGLMLARVDGKSPVEYLDDGQRAHIRSVARAMLSRPRATLADVNSYIRSAA